MPLFWDSPALKGCLPAQSPDVCKCFPKTNPFQHSALKLTYLLGGEARARHWMGPIVFPSVCGSRCRRPGGGSTTACGVVCLQTLIHSRDNTWKIKQATHAIPGTPARLILCFSIISFSSPSGGSLLWHFVYEKSKPPTGQAPDKELGIAQEFPGRGIFVLVSSPWHC